MEETDRGQLVRAVTGFLGFFAGLCTIFAMVVTIAEGWQEHSQAQWPETTARVEQCRMRQTSTGRRQAYYVDCQLSYVVGNEGTLTRLYSRNVPSPAVWQYPRQHLYEQFEEWVEQHPQGQQLRCITTWQIRKK